MSGPLKLSTEDLRNVADFLDRLSRATRDTCVSANPYGDLHVGINGCTMAITWDAQSEEYRIYDRVGS